MPRFYCSPPLPLNGRFNLPPDAAHHAARVLRLREGSSVEIFDGLGNACHGIIDEISSKRVVIRGIVADSVNRESPLHITLAQALSSSEKMDWVVQKATELGAAEIQPVDTRRSVAKLPAERTAKRLDHWRQVAISACEQCGRNVLPVIHAPLGIMTWLQQKLLEQPDAAKFIMLPQSAASLHVQARPQGNILLLTGAEGGFTQAECDSALSCGFTPISMGPRILRTETAAVAGLAVLQTLWGDFC